MAFGCSSGRALVSQRGSSLKIEDEKRVGKSGLNRINKKGESQGNKGCDSDIYAAEFHRISMGGVITRGGVFTYGNEKGAELMISPAPVSNNLTIAIFT